MSVPESSVKVETPLLVPVLAALPVCACMAILGLPAFGHGYAAAFRTLYFIACLAWLIPLALLQRAMWRRDWPWLRMALVLLVASYAMSILNAVLGQRLAISLGLETGYQWGELVQGLDGCWLALIAFCAVHAVAAYYLSLQQVHLRLQKLFHHQVVPRRGSTPLLPCHRFQPVRSNAFIESCSIDIVERVCGGPKSSSACATGAKLRRWCGVGPSARSASWWTRAA